MKPREGQKLTRHFPIFDLRGGREGGGGGQGFPSILSKIVGSAALHFLYGMLRGRPGGGYSHTLPIRVCAAQRGRDFEAPDLEWGIHFGGVV